MLMFCIFSGLNENAFYLDILIFGMFHYLKQHWIDCHVLCKTWLFILFKHLNLTPINLTSTCTCLFSGTWRCQLCHGDRANERPYNSLQVKHDYRIYSTLQLIMYISALITTKWRKMTFYNHGSNNFSFLACCSCSPDGDKLQLGCGLFLLFLFVLNFTFHSHRRQKYSVHGPPGNTVTWHPAHSFT